MNLEMFWNTGYFEGKVDRIDVPGIFMKMLDPLTWIAHKSEIHELYYKVASVAYLNQKIDVDIYHFICRKMLSLYGRDIIRIINDVLTYRINYLHYYYEEVDLSSDFKTIFNLSDDIAIKSHAYYCYLVMGQHDNISDMLTSISNDQRNGYSDTTCNTAKIMACYMLCESPILFKFPIRNVWSILDKNIQESLLSCNFNRPIGLGYIELLVEAYSVAIFFSDKRKIIEHLYILPDISSYPFIFENDHWPYGIQKYKSSMNIIGLLSFRDVYRYRLSCIIDDFTKQERCPEWKTVFNHKWSR